MDLPRAPRRVTLSPSPRAVDSEDRASSVESLGLEKSRLDDRPPLFHRIKDARSILALAVSKSVLYAGNQGGELVAWSLETYEQLVRKIAHGGAVLGLQIAHDEQWLLSCAGDAIVNVWRTPTLTRVFSIYSTYDVGDVFCVAYSSLLRTLFLGAQNTSIQWCDLAEEDSRPKPDLERHPSQRNHRFFDSKGPGGLSTPRPDDAIDPAIHGGEILEIDKVNIVQYAHFGYVYCMALCKGFAHERGETLISAGGDGTVKLWKLNVGPQRRIEELHSLHNGDNPVLTMALNNTILYVGQSEGRINVWDLETRQILQSFAAYRADVMTLSIAHGVVFTGGADGIAKIFERYKCKSLWKAHEHLILASAVHEQNGKLYLITGGNDEWIASWDLTEMFTSSAVAAKPSLEQLVQSLSEFISFRTVSSRPDYAEDCRQGASWLRNLFKKYGATTQLLRLEQNQNPVVFARFRGKGKNRRQVLFYGHYDVVAAESGSSQWESDPFEMDGRGGYFYGRGVSDNKGPILAAIYAVADLMAEQDLNCDVTFLIEGEEECGSRGFETCVRQNKDLIGNVDWILLANAYWLNDDLPCLTYGLRGVVHMEINVEGGQRDLHSGVNGSHLMDEPVKDLVTLLSTLSTKDGRIHIPGFYDDILPPTPAEEQRYKTIVSILKSPRFKQDIETLKARWREPSLTIHGFKTSGSGNKTIIPRSASASISLRLVPNQHAVKVQDVLEKCLHERWEALGTTNQLTVTAEHPVDPWLGDPENTIYQVLDKAVTEVWKLREGEADHDDEFLEGITSQISHTKGRRKSSTTSKNKTLSLKKGANTAPTNSIAALQKSDTKLHHPLYIREGGSIPVIRFLEREFDAPAAQLPCGQSSDSAHLDNERIRLLNLYNSRDIFKRVFRDLTSTK
jgi:di- and tripeptidase